MLRLKLWREKGVSVLRSMDYGIMSHGYKINSVTLADGQIRSQPFPSAICGVYRLTGRPYSIAVGTTDQLSDVTLGSMERRRAILSVRSFCLPGIRISALSRVRSLFSSSSL